MTKVWDKAKTGFEKLQPKLQKLDLKEAEKRKKQIKDAVASAWKAEDDFTDAIEAAVKAGVTGKKLVEFAKDDKVKSTLAAFKKASDLHRAKVKALADYCAPVAALCKEARQLKSDLGKEMKKSKASLNTKENNDFLKSAKAQTEVIEAINKVQGSLTAPELLYGINFKRLAETLFLKTTKQGGPGKTDAKLKDLFELKSLTANGKTATNLSKLVDKHDAAALDKIKDGAKAAAADVAKAETAMGSLDAMARQYADAMKKGAAELKASPDQSKIRRAVTGILKTHKQTAKAHAAAKATLDKAPA